MCIRECIDKGTFLSRELPEWDTSRETAACLGREDILGDRLDLFIGLRECAFPLFALQIRELCRTLSDIFRDARELGHRDIDLISLLVLDLHILPLDESDTLPEYLDISTDTMLAMDDEVSWLELHEEIQIFYRTLSGPIHYEYPTEYIIPVEMKGIIFYIRCPLRPEKCTRPLELEARMHMLMLE